MSGIVGSTKNIRGSGVVAKLGTDGQVFTSAGAGKKQTFEDAAGGGAWTLIERQATDDTDGVSELQFDEVFSATYDIYKIYILGGLGSQTTANPLLRLLVGTTAQTGTYMVNEHGAQTGSTASSGTTSHMIEFHAQTTGWLMTVLWDNMWTGGNDIKRRCFHEITMYNPYQTDTYIQCHIQSGGMDREHTVGTFYRLNLDIWGMYLTATACDGFDYLMDVGDIEQATVAVYGLNKS